MAIQMLKRLFGRSDEGSADTDSNYSDSQGIYLFVECERCGARLRLRADKKYDLNRVADGYTWHKTLIDSQCFRPMPTVVSFDKQFNVVSREIDGGRYITQEEFEAEPEQPPAGTTEEALEHDPPEQEKDVT